MTKLLESPEVRPHDSSVIEAPRPEVPLRKELPPAPKRGIRWMRWMAGFAVVVASAVALTLLTSDGGPSAAYPVWDPSIRNTAWIEEMRVHPEINVPAAPHALSAFRTPFDIEVFAWMDIPVWNPSLEFIESQARVHPLTEMYVPGASSLDGYWNAYTLEWVPFGTVGQPDGYWNSYTLEWVPFQTGPDGYWNATPYTLEWIPFD